MRLDLIAIKLVLFLAFSSAKYIIFDILYEREIVELKHNFLKEVINLILNNYNIHLKEFEIKFYLDSILDYKQYSNMPEYKKYASQVGKDNLETRIAALAKIKKNFIIIYSSRSSLNYEKINCVNTNKDRFFVNLMSYEHLNEEVLQISIDAIKKYMAKMLNIEVPEFYELDSVNPVSNKAYLKRKQQDTNADIEKYFNIKDEIGYYSPNKIKKLIIQEKTGFENIVKRQKNGFAKVNCELTFEEAPSFNAREIENYPIISKYDMKKKHIGSSHFKINKSEKKLKTRSDDCSEENSESKVFLDNGSQYDHKKVRKFVFPES